MSYSILFLTCQFCQSWESKPSLSALKQKGTRLTCRVVVHVMAVRSMLAGRRCTDHVQPTYGYWRVPTCRIPRYVHVGHRCHWLSLPDSLPLSMGIKQAFSPELSGLAQIDNNPQLVYRSQQCTAGQLSVGSNELQLSKSAAYPSCTEWYRSTTVYGRAACRWSGQLPRSLGRLLPTDRQIMSRMY